MTGPIEPGWVHDGQAWCAPAASAEQMRARGAEVARVLGPGDVVILDGPLGAGKTTFTQGIGEALGVRGPVTSPTFVIARSHPPRERSGAGPGPWLVHVDAYRLRGSVEVDDLDLDADMERAVTVVEWGAGRVEGLATDRLDVRIRREVGAGLGAQAESADLAGGSRTVLVRGVGPRWAGLVLGSQ